MAAVNRIAPYEAQPRPGVVRARELSEITILIAAMGMIDATNAKEVWEYIERNATGYRQLVLDFSKADFFGTAGYSLLCQVHSFCARAAVDWVLVAGPEVRRLLRVCDPGEVLPTAANIVSAVAALARSPHRIPQLRATLR